MRNCHPAVAGLSGTARAATKVAILLDLKKAHGVGGTVFDIGCSFGHFMLAALQMGCEGACGCDLPENHMQYGSKYAALARSLSSQPLSRRRD